MNIELSHWMLAILILILIVGYFIGWFIRGYRCRDVAHDLKSATIKGKMLQSNLDTAESDYQVANAERGKLQKELATVKDDLNKTIRVQGKALESCKTRIDELEQLQTESNIKMAGYHVFRASDAQKRAMKSVAVKSYNSAARQVNKAIERGVFEKWKNPPKPITLVE